MYTGTRGPLEEFLLNRLARMLKILLSPIQWYNDFLTRIGLYDPNRELYGMTVSRLVATWRVGHGSDDAAAGEFRRRGVQAREELIQMLARARALKTSRIGQPSSVSGRTMAIVEILTRHFPSDESWRAIETLRLRLTDSDTQESLVQSMADIRATLTGQLTPDLLSEWIGMSYPHSRLAQADLRLAHAAPEHRVYLLQSLPRVALQAGDEAKAEDYARELLDLPELAATSGEAVYSANYALAVLAWKRGDVAKAKEHLLEAARTPGSVRLSNVGPDTGLPQELLDSGERDAVLEYFERSKSFSKSHEALIDQWQNTIRTGGVPNFRRAAVQ